MRRGFTFVELLVVLLVMALLAGMIASLPKGSRRHAAVKAAAEELAATLRSARALAMERRTIVGVAFNIANAPGSSGLVVNNHAGGHWYQITGEVQVSDSPSSLASYPNGKFVDQSVNGDGNVAQFLDAVQDSWVGERHVLKTKTVRFLALGDQDNGSEGWTSNGEYPPTYPRPWFGWYDDSARKLRPWGGYDPTILDKVGRPCGGFYFQGEDGVISGCLNPTDRFTTHIGSSGNIPPRKFLAAGEVRPLVNGDWLDYVIVFYPDGTANEQSPMSSRRRSYWDRGSTTAGYSAGGTGNGDLGDYTAHRSGMGSPITSYVRHTGSWSITLAPDATRDSDSFASRTEALDSIWPLYRVSVTSLGDVKISYLTKVVPGGTTFDTTSISDWQNASQMRSMYQKDIATNANGSPRGMPVTDFLTPDILASRQWWLVSP